ncbi:Imm1 family immunity protein [Kribbella sp. NPDC059898]|uniref:Imm1 family immunity protein n=1 Tax=Kribbella sp. NPDC059898 TaxID=3346995 RepID=UPI00364FE10B
MSKTVEAYYRPSDGPTLLKNADDVDALIDTVLAEPFGNSVIALYSAARPLVAAGVPDHELRVALHAEANVGGIRYAGDDGAQEGSWYVPGQVSSREEVFYYYAGHDQGWPQDSEVTIEQVRRAAREFVSGNGARPGSFEWRAWPEAVS